MPRLTFFGVTYEYPPDINVIVRAETTCPLCTTEGEHIADFDFYRDGKIIPMLGGTDIEGNSLPTWEDVGIKILGRGIVYYDEAYEIVTKRPQALPQTGVNLEGPNPGIDPALVAQAFEDEFGLSPEQEIKHRRELKRLSDQGLIPPLPDWKPKLD